MNNGLFDPVIVGFVFTPLAVTGALILAVWWKHGRVSRAGLDMPSWLLASATRALPETRLDWGTAMLAELTAVHGTQARWRFALSCLRVTLYSPPAETLLQPAGHRPIFGMLAVALPPLGLPLLYFAALMLEAIGGSPFTQASRWNHPEVVIVVVKIILRLTLGCLLAGLPLGLAGWWRRERLRWLSGFGMSLSLGIFGYFLLVMHFLAGGD